MRFINEIYVLASSLSFLVAEFQSDTRTKTVREKVNYTSKMKIPIHNWNAFHLAKRFARLSQARLEIAIIKMLRSSAKIINSFFFIHEICNQYKTIFMPMVFSGSVQWELVLHRTQNHNYFRNGGLSSRRSVCCIEGVGKLRWRKSCLPKYALKLVDKLTCYWRFPRKKEHVPFCG